jgi:hypothetical protein
VELNQRRSEMVQSGQIVTEVITATKSATVLEHILERRLEYLIGTLIAHQMGILDFLLVYGHGVCA